MRPLAELDVEGVAAVFTDVDDTLTWRGALVPEAYQAIVALADAGIPVGLATGRAGGFAEVLSVLWPVAFAVAENGGYAVLRGGEARYWDPPEVRSDQRAKLESLVAQADREMPHVRLAADSGLRRVDVAWDLHEHADVGPEDTQRLVDLCGQHGARVLTSSIHLHAFHGDHDKAGMLIRLAAEQLGLDERQAREDCVFVGDSPNEQAGFTAFARSVGVANVVDHRDRLEPAPAFVTSKPGGFGFAQVADMLLAAH